MNKKLSLLLFGMLASIAFLPQDIFSHGGGGHGGGGHGGGGHGGGGRGGRGGWGGRGGRGGWGGHGGRGGWGRGGWGYGGWGYGGWGWGLGLSYLPLAAYSAAYPYDYDGYYYRSREDADRARAAAESAQMSARDAARSAEDARYEIRRRDDIRGMQSAPRDRQDIRNAPDMQSVRE